MFKSSENLRLAAEMRALERVARPWREARTTWFDGTPESIEMRLAATDRVLAHARSGFTTAHLALTREAGQARAELVEAKHRLLTDFLDDGARAFKGSQRVAGRHEVDPEHPWKNTIHEDKYWDLMSTPDFADLYTEDGEPVGKHRAEAGKTANHPLGPGYDRPGFGPDDIAEYEDYLHQHDYHTDDTDLNEMAHRLHPGLDEDDPARYSSLRTAGDGPGGIGDPTVDDIFEQQDAYRRYPEEQRARANAGFLEEMDPEDRPGYGEVDTADCRHCGERIEDYGNGWEHPDGYLPIYGDHDAVPDDEDDEEGSRPPFESAREAGRPAGDSDDDDEDVCAECGASLDDGEGYDGYCGSCADKLEENHHWGSRRTADWVSDRQKRIHDKYQGIATPELAKAYRALNSYDDDIDLFTELNARAQGRRGMNFPHRDHDPDEEALTALGDDFIGYDDEDNDPPWRWTPGTNHFPYYGEEDEDDDDDDPSHHHGSHKMPDGSDSPDEAESARYVLDFMRRRGLDKLTLDDENRYPSYQRDFDDEDELDDAVAWVPKELIHNPGTGRRPWNPILRRQDLEEWFARNPKHRRVPRGDYQMPPEADPGTNRNLLSRRED